ncbi:hypothetical protein LOZ53_005358 [Ophidiomyces ophidiicola]|uniref:Uncharacterized protein n=1 Tax=Ophidiomyces ophidiicola TaxID=1387563 RepID=A0ACB8V5L7_9EURO|nr:uncharacterized protein LOZ57_003167 [Ophidiomyces ophidiicola]KAI1911177.1 hypothetical protein LOZ61_003995 [Ophidiomyces ophidiicola]KAI1918844.1 hypothetical protein LOZ64_002606 [Ophidiomyces ophidiicola]KAI1923852.1 hypothetical protein LOZ60_004994 [Ophidiomyces ophidiicola]KAI1939870.1 hypothetical protein LOZ62_004964 [Ophidiomyces ophidiicola]KAI1947440.1 hypothetical protein LOZ57_003167 [Ophidiomyces ophidiicola]
MAEAEPSLNIPSLLTLAVVSFFVIRWFFSRPGDGNGESSGQRSGSRSRVDPAQVEQLAQMFPQLNRRDIMWDLQRNGGSVAATTERVLGGRGLETPPPSFQPNIPEPASPAIPATSTTSSKQPTDDLITRYNLSSRIKEGVATVAAATDSSTIIRPESAWSQNKSERQRLLQKRRDDMILAARRKMLEKDGISGQS